ncbi:MAG: hypothetical protein ACRCXZ_00375 [Patescibacteria group bacterium]
MTRIADIMFFEERQNTGLPFSFFIQNGEGPHMIICSASHGNEPVGIKTTHKLIELIETGKVYFNGKITFICLNPNAYLEDKRFIEKNFNRSFCEEIVITHEGNRAKEVENYLNTIKYDLLIDLHSVSTGDLEMVVVKTEDKKSIIAAKEVNLSGTILSIPGKVFESSILEIPFKSNSIGIIVECGNNRNPNTLIHGVESIMKFGLYIKLFTNFQTNLLETNTNTKLNMYEVIDVVKPYDNWNWQVPISTFTPVNKADLIGKVDSNEYFAVHSGYIAMPSLKPNAKDSDAGFYCILK